LSVDPRLLSAIQSLPIDAQAKGTLLATTFVESGGRLDAVGDQGSSYGPYQMHRGGRLTSAGYTPEQAMDPVLSTQAAWKEFSKLRLPDPGSWAARAQRPADPKGYANKVRGIYQRAMATIGGATPAAIPVAPVGGAGSDQIGGVAAPGGFSPEAMRKLSTYLRDSERMALAGKMPSDPTALFQELIASRSAGAAPMPAGPTNAPTGVASVQPGGGWEGTQAPVTDLFQRFAAPMGLKATSEKRDRRNTKSGGVSDHYVGSTNAYAIDMGGFGERPTPKADQAASGIVSALGGPANWGQTGGVFNTTIGGIRYQVLYRTDTGGNHWNHIHVGARRV
jgi:hypothetical protein